MAFCGRFTGNAQGTNDDYREYSDADADSIRRVVGEELDDFWGISTSDSDWELEDDPDTP